MKLCNVCGGEKLPKHGCRACQEVKRQAKRLLQLPLTKPRAYCRHPDGHISWAKANPEKEKAKNAKWVAQNREKVRQHKAKWRASNKEAISILSQKRRAHKKGCKGVLSKGIKKSYSFCSEAFVRVVNSRLVRTITWTTSCHWHWVV